MLENLTRDDFAAHAGEEFVVHAADDLTVTMTLREARPLSSGTPGGRAPFALLFVGPPAPLLEQRIYAIEHPTLGRLDIFIVPIGADAERVQYEAIFT